jgi:hypothetical protein
LLDSCFGDGGGAVLGGFGVVAVELAFGRLVGMGGEESGAALGDGAGEARASAAA